MESTGINWSIGYLINGMEDDNEFRPTDKYVCGTHSFFILYIEIGVNICVWNYRENEKVPNESHNDRGRWLLVNETYEYM